MKTWHRPAAQRPRPSRVPTQRTGPAGVRLSRSDEHLGGRQTRGGLARACPPAALPTKQAAGRPDPEGRCARPGCRQGEVDLVVLQRSPFPEDLPGPGLPTGQPCLIRGEPIDRPAGGTAFGQAVDPGPRQAGVAAVEDPPPAWIEDGHPPCVHADPQERPAAMAAGEKAHDPIGRQAGVLGVVDGPGPAGPVRQAPGGGDPQLVAPAAVQEGDAEHAVAGESLLHCPAFAVIPHEAAAVGRGP